jgi:hypothetical protein
MTKEELLTILEKHAERYWDLSDDGKVPDSFTITRKDFFEFQAHGIEQIIKEIEELYG